MNKLDKLKLASSSLGERLMTGGVQMSRVVGTKMKEILQVSTPESKIVDEATKETMEEADWGLNLRICAMINSEELNGTEIVKAIKKKIFPTKNAVSQRLSLELLESCTSNCDKVFSEVASEKVLDSMVAMIQDSVNTIDRNRYMAIDMISGWGESEELMYLPVFRQTYLDWKNNWRPRPTRQAMESRVYEQPTLPQDNCSLPELDLMGIEDENLTYTYSGQTVDQKKELLVVGRNSLDLLSSILNSGMEPIPINDELTVSILEKCKESLIVVQRIAETTTSDDILLFEALNLHDELEQTISRCTQIKQAVKPEPSEPVPVSQHGTIVEPWSSNEETGLTSNVEVNRKDEKSSDMEESGLTNDDKVNRKDESFEQEQGV